LKEKKKKDKKKAIKRMRNQFEKKKWNKMLRDKIQRKQNRPRYGKKNSKENEYYIWYKNKTKSNEKSMKLKKNLKKNLKQWKTNQKKEDYNWKTKCIRGQLWFLTDLAQISRSEKRKQGDEKKSQLSTNHHDLSNTSYPISFASTEHLRQTKPAIL